MSKEQVLLLINEIKDIEQQLFEKQSKLAFARHISDIPDYGLDADSWKKEFQDIINNLKTISAGGNSVEDVRKERR